MFVHLIKNTIMSSRFRTTRIVIDSYLWPGVPALARRSVASVGTIVSGSAYWSWGAYFSSISLKTSSLVKYYTHKLTYNIF